MITPSFAERKHELLATSVALVFTFYSLRASFISAQIRTMFAGVDAEFPLFTRLVFGHSGMVTTLVVVLAAITLWAIWSRHRLGSLVATAGILSLGVGTELLRSAVISPIVEMINTMGQQ